MSKKIIFLGILIIILLNLNFVSAGEGGATVPITTIDLTEQGTDYSMKPGRLKFEFDGKLYAIQIRRVKQEYVDFLVMTLDMNKLDDITAYIIDNSFSLNPGEKKEIDIDKEGIKDISIELNAIISTGKYNSIRSANFSIKKINTKKSETILSNENENIGINNMEVIGSNNITEEDIEVQESVSEPILNQESKKQSTFLEKIINFFKELF